jgi:acetyl esterase/lipase
MSAGDHIIVLPGGGYAVHAPHEAEPIAEWLFELGVEASVFRYPVHTRHPGPLDAVRDAVRAARDAGATRVGLLGFSAGGHAAGMAALAPRSSDPATAAAERVDAVVLGYPVVSMLLPTDAGSRTNLLGDAPTEAERAATSLDRLVSAEAAPFFVWHTGADERVPVEHSYLLGQALAAAGVPHELHVFPEGAHGLGLAADAPGAHAWPGLCADWLQRGGWLS